MRTNTNFYLWAKEFNELGKEISFSILGVEVPRTNKEGLWSLTFKHAEA